MTGGESIKRINIYEIGTVQAKQFKEVSHLFSLKKKAQLFSTKNQEKNSGMSVAFSGCSRRLSARASEPLHRDLP